MVSPHFESIQSPGEKKSLSVLFYNDDHNLAAAQQYKPESKISGCPYTDCTWASLQHLIAVAILIQQSTGRVTLEIKAVNSDWNLRISGKTST